MKHLGPLALSAALLALACSDDELEPRTFPDGGGSSSSGSGSGSGGSSGGGGGGGSGGSSGSGGGSLAPLGVLDIASVPDVPCVAHTGLSAVLYPPGGEPAFDILARVADRRVAGGRFAGGFVTFGLDGSSPTPVPVAPFESSLVASEGTTLGVAGFFNGTAAFRRYAADESPLGGVVTIDTGAVSVLAVGGGDGASAVLVSDGGVVRVRRVWPAGTVGPLLPLSIESEPPLVGVTARIDYGDGSFGAAWAGGRADGSFLSRFARVAPDGSSAPLVELTGPSAAHWISAITRTPTGHALLLSGGSPPDAAYLVLLDPGGKVVSAARKLGGASYGYGIAALGTEIGVVAKRTSGEAAFRRFSADGASLGPWVCLDQPSMDSFDMAGIDADGAGWAIVYRTPQGAEVLLRLDATGTMAP